MDKKLIAVVVIVLFLSSGLAIIAPAQAHFTLGDTIGNYPFHENDFDPHVPGVIGYVWPGGGEDSYSGVPNFASNLNPPGYQSPYPCTASPAGVGGTTAVSCAPSGAPSSSWYQLQGSSYAPFGAVLVGSTGDLIFALNATKFEADGRTPLHCPTGSALPAVCRWDTVGILLPPGFSGIQPPQVVTTITNDYTGISVMRVGPYDRYAPGWTLVMIQSDAGISSTAPPSTNHASSSVLPYYDHQGIDFTSAGEWYYIRINGVVAPSIAGRYFFKILLWGDTRALCGEEGVVPDQVYPGFSSGPLPGNSFPSPPAHREDCSQFIPTENWPVLLVKGEIDPAIVTGTVRYGGYNSTLYGQPIGEAGMVYAKMTTRLDPYTGQPRPDLPTVDAQGFFNGTTLCLDSTEPQCSNPPATAPTLNHGTLGANGHYEVEGVAPGIYDIYAQAAGFPQQVCASGVTILKGQSLHFDCYVQPGPVIHGNVYTKHQFGDEPWMGELPNCATSPSAFPDCSTNTYNEYIKIELYDSPTLSNIPDPSANLVSWSPLPCVAGGQEMYEGNTNAFTFCGDPRMGDNIAFPWHEYTPSNGYYAGASTPGANPLFYETSTGGGFGNSGVGGNTAQINKLTQDPQGVGPPQHWYVIGGTTTPFHYEFGVKGEYGAPRDLSGMVPQVYATWINGLTPGRYYARAWVFRYVQTALDGSTFQEYYFDVTPQEWAGDVTLPIDLRLSSWVNKTVHFHNTLNGLTEDPIDTGAGLISGVLVDANGVVWSYNQSLLGYNPGDIPGHPEGLYTQGHISGWENTAFHDPTTVRSLVDLDPAKVNAYAINEGRANIQFWGWNDTWGGENYGIPSGTYTPHAFVLGYLEQGPAEQVSVTLSGTPTSVSDHLYRGVGFNITLYSIDWERPTVNRNWVWGNPVGYPACGFFNSTSQAIGNPVYAGPGSCSRLGNYGGIFAAGKAGSSLGSGPTFPGDPRCPGASLATPNDGCMVGEEIDIGVYQNHTLTDFIGDVPTELPDTVLSSCLFQSQRASNATLCGGGWDPQSAYGSYNGNSYDAYFGQELQKPGNIGGYMGGLLYFSVSRLLFGPAHYSPTNLPDGGVYNQAVAGYTNLYPTANAGGEYYFRGFTYGYVQDEDYAVYGLPTQVADIRLNLVIGVNITLDVLFKKEHVITPTDANMSARVRIFDDQGELAAEWMSSEGVYTPPNNCAGTSVSGNGCVVNGVTQNGRAVAADGTDQFPFGPLHPAVPVPQSLNTYNFLPGGVSLLHVVMAGLPQVPAAGTDAGPLANNVPQGVYPNDPTLATTTCGFQVDCYVSPGARLGVGVPGYFPNTGILGAPDYTGGWTAEVDFVNWYNNNTRTTTWTSLPFESGGTTGIVTPNGAQYYPPVQGLLLGESYHIIPGTTATSGISLTEDLALNPVLIGHSLVQNHLGPYAQEGVWQISGTHLSGEASGIFEVDLNGFVSGTALAFTWANDFRPLSWATVSVSGAPINGTAPFNFYTYDGLYQMYLMPGNYQLTISNPGVASQTLSIAVTGGEASTAANVYLQESNIPVPEFSGLAVVAFSALAASVYLLRRSRRT